MPLLYEHGIVEMRPGPADMHSHPRVFDPITTHDISGLNGYEGKAGLPLYTELANAGVVDVFSLINSFPRQSLNRSTASIHKMVVLQAQIQHIGK